MNDITNRATTHPAPSCRGCGTTRDQLVDALIQRRTRLAFAMTALTLAVYFSFLLTIAFAPQWLTVHISHHSLLTTGIVAALGLFCFSAVSAGIYVQIANRTVEPLALAVLEASKGTAHRTTSNNPLFKEHMQ